MCLFTDQSTLQVTTRLRHIVDLKKRAGWVQDGQKKKPALAKEMFFPVSACWSLRNIHFQYFSTWSTVVIQCVLEIPVKPTYVCMYVCDP